MKHFKRTIVFILALVMTVTLLPAAVQAASTKTVYVVSGVKVKEGKTTTEITLSYNDNGLLKKIASTYADEKVSETFAYNNKNLLKKYVNKVLTGKHKGTVDTSTYKYYSSGLRKSKTENEGEPVTYQYNKKNQIISETGEHGSTQYTYNKYGHVRKTASDDGNFSYSATFDDNGNITKWARKFQTEKIGYGSYTITYNSAGRVKTIKGTEKANPMAPEHTRTLTFTYTKMKVSADLADAIAEQQWQFINRNSGVAFAW